MRIGYGRGYYGGGQLAQPPRRRSSLWIKFALVAGAGAVIWLMWPRNPKPEHEPGPGEDASKSPLPLPAPPEVVAQIAQAPQPPQLSQGTEMRGYPSQQAYEDAVVANARQLQATGARVVLAPHLAHLAPRLVGPEDLTASSAPR